MKNSRLFCLIIAVLFSACATQDKGPIKKFKPKQKAPAAIETTQPKPQKPKMEVIKVEPKPVSVTSTPKGRASAKLVDAGKTKFYENDFEEAQRAFQQAINIDPQNGVAYYYLAKAKFELGEYEKADGFLDKAEMLLQGSKEWEETISTLRDLIKEKI